MNIENIKHNLSQIKQSLRIDPAWKKDLQDELNNYARQHPQPQVDKSTVPGLRFPRFSYRFALSCIIALGLMLLPVGVTYAQQATPGEILYPVKRLVEEAQVLLTFEEADRIQLRLEQTLRRVQELEMSVQTATHTTQVKAAMETEKALDLVVELPQTETTESTFEQVQTKIERIIPQVTPPPIRVKLGQIQEKVAQVIETEPVETNNDNTDLTPTPTVTPNAVPTIKLPAEKRVFEFQLSPQPTIVLTPIPISTSTPTPTLTDTPTPTSTLIITPKISLQPVDETPINLNVAPELISAP